jgi:hypothetical protein
MTVPLAELSVDTNAQSDPASGAGAGLRLPGETWTAFHFDEATKNPAFDTRFVGQEPFLIANSGRIVRSGEVLRMMLVGPTENEGFPDVFARARRTPGGSITVADWQMPLVAERAGGDNADNVPYHVRVLSRLTTLASREDGQDNDNLQGADSPREGLIAGLINVNTAPQHLLERVIPHPGSADIALRIATLRDDPALLGRGGSYKGLAHISEIDTNPGTGAGAKAIDDLFGLGDDSGDLVDLSGIVMDFNENELPGTSAYRTPGTPDGRTDDREEATLMTKYLAQVLGTRSDIFTAYILVRKYPANDFRSGAELEEYRLVAVFDRSSVSETGSRVRVLAIAEVE